MSTSEVVLVTGGSGFIAVAIILHLVEKGYKVKATVRSQHKADAVVQKHPHLKASVDWLIVSDFAAPGAFDEAVKNVDYIIHTACPFHAHGANGEEFLRPIVAGTASLFEAAVQQPRIKRVVLTSTFSTFFDFSKGYQPGKTFTEEDFNEVTYEEVATSNHPAFIYLGSKTIAEKAAWTFMKDRSPSFTLTCLNPALIIGPPSQPISSMSGLNQSLQWMWEVIGEGRKEMPFTIFPTWVDVRDCATLHVSALTNPKAANRRYGVTAGHFSNDQVAHIVAKAFPEHADLVVPSKNDPPYPHYGTDSSRVENDFGIKWIGFETSVVDMARELYRLKKELGE